MLVSLSTTSEKVTEFRPGPMGASTQGTGKTVSNMAQDPTRQIIPKRSQDLGKKANL